MSSTFSVEENDSATALSRTWRGRGRLCRIPCLDSSRVNCFEVYWLPRSEWKIRPRFGRRWLIAIRSASQINSARRWSAMAQPTTRREARSITLARYLQPSPVHPEVMSPARQTSSSAGWKCRPIRSASSAGGADPAGSARSSVGPLACASTSSPPDPASDAARRPVPPPGTLEAGLDLLGPLPVLLGSPGRLLPAPLGVGGPGDLRDRARPVDAALSNLLRLDERPPGHRASLAKNAVARFRRSRSSRRTRTSLRRPPAPRARCWSDPAADRRRSPPAAPTAGPPSRSGRAHAPPRGPTDPPSGRAPPPPP